MYTNGDEEKDELAAFLMEPMTEEKKNNLGVVVGRFHVPKLHDGHTAVLNKALWESRRLAIFVGVTPVLDSIRNPMDFQTREMMLRATYGHQNPIILPIMDAATDERWSYNLDCKIKEIEQSGSVMLYGSRDSFLHHYNGKYKHTIVDVVKGPSGTTLREAVRNHPLPSADFRAGVIYGKANMYPSVHPTVDMAVWKQEGSNYYLLLGRKPAERLFRFPGGFVDPSDSSYECAALRELKEETNISPGDVTTPVYVCSRLVDDWRYRQDRSKITTTLFSMKYDFSEEEAQAGDDLAEVKWFNINDITLLNEQMEDVHRPLFNEFIKRKPWLKS